MNTVRTNLAVVLWLLVVVAPAAADSKADPREKPETAVAEGIRLLEAKEYATFLKNFVPPDEFKRITEKTSLEEFAKRFGEKRGSRMLQVLKSIKDAKPTMDADGKKATYELKEDVGGKKSMTWVKVDKYWYIRN